MILNKNFRASKFGDDTTYWNNGSSTGKWRVKVPLAVSCKCLWDNNVAKAIIYRFICIANAFRKILNQQLCFSGEQTL